MWCVASQLFLFPQVLKLSFSQSKHFVWLLPFASMAKLLLFARHSFSGLRKLSVSEYTVMFFLFPPINGRNSVTETSMCQVHICPRFAQLCLKQSELKVCQVLALIYVFKSSCFAKSFCPPAKYIKVTFCLLRSVFVSVVSNKIVNVFIIELSNFCLFCLFS